VILWTQLPGKHISAKKPVVATPKPQLITESEPAVAASTPITQLIQEVEKNDSSLMKAMAETSQATLEGGDALLQVISWVGLTECSWMKTNSSCTMRNRTSHESEFS